MAWLAECFPSVHRAQGSIPAAHQSPGVVTHTWKSSIRKWQELSSAAQPIGSHPGLRRPPSQVGVGEEGWKTMKRAWRTSGFSLKIRLEFLYLDFPSLRWWSVCVCVYITLI